MEIIYKSYIKLKNIKDVLSSKIRVFILNQSNNIVISKDVFIHKTAIIQIKYGGKIFIDSGTEIQENVVIQTYGGVIKIGKNCSTNSGTIIYGHGNTLIGNDVLIAGGCMVIPNNHVFSKLDIPIRMQGCIAKGINIQDNVWIGHGCSILDGVNILHGTVIGAGSVVNKSTIENTIYAGVPAKKILNRL